MVGIAKFLTKLDRYGAKVRMNYNGKDSYANPIGGCLSLIINMLILIYSCKILVGLVMIGEPLQLSYTV